MCADQCSCRRASTSRWWGRRAASTRLVLAIDELHRHRVAGRGDSPVSRASPARDGFVPTDAASSPRCSTISLTAPKRSGPERETRRLERRGRLDLRRSVPDRRASPRRSMRSSAGRRAPLQLRAARAARPGAPGHRRRCWRPAAFHRAGSPGRGDGRQFLRPGPLLSYVGEHPLRPQLPLVALDQLQHALPRVRSRAGRALVELGA
jgi:hypothetical protein